MLVFEITALGLLTFCTVLASGSKCPKETLTRHVVCYYKGEVPLSNLTVCDCTHLIFTNAVTKNVNHSLDIGEGIKNDLVLLKETKSDLITILTLTLKEDESSKILKSKRKGRKVIDGISAILEETQFDGVELDFKFGKGDGISKDSYTSFIKHLSKSITSQHRRVKRDELKPKVSNTTTTTTTTVASKTSTNATTLSENIATTILPVLEEKPKQQKDDFPKFLKSKNNSQPITNSSDSNNNFKKFLLLIRLPIQLEILVKKYDLKALTRYADILTVPTHHIFNENEAHLTYHPSRLMGLSDIFNADSILDFLTGMGAEKSKIVISMPASVLKFQLKDETKNAPGSPAVSGPVMLDQAELCSILKKKNWTLERDEDLTAPYAFSGKIWIAFEDEVSVKIKGKYILLRQLAGGAIYPIDDDINDKSCTNSTEEGGYLTHYLYNNFKSLERKPRALVLQNLQEEIHNTAYSSIEAGVRLSEYRIVRVVDHSGAVHVIRKNTKTQFECSRQGYFSHPLGCNKFYRCVKFDQYSDEFTVFEYNCPVGLAFDERYEVCVWPGSLPNGAPCTGSSEIAPVPRSHFQCPNQEGYYADVENCRWFFACLDHARDGITPLTAYEFRCPFGLVFNAEKLACDWPWLVGGCGAHGAQGYIFGQSGGSSSASNTAVFINGGNLGASLGQYDAGNQDTFLGKGFGTVLKNIDSSAYGGKIQNSYQGSQSAAAGFIASPFYDNSKRGSFAAFPDYEISGGRIFNKGEGVVLEENLNFAGGVKGLYPNSKLKSGYINGEHGVTVDSGSNAAAGYYGYSGPGRSDEVVNTGFGEKNLESIYASNGHFGKEINGVITGSNNANQNEAFSANIASHDRTDSNFGNAYATGQLFGQDIIANSGKSKIDYAGIGFSSENAANKNLKLGNGVQYNIVKAGQNSHIFSNINLPLNKQVLDNQNTDFQELLPPFAGPIQPQQVLIESPISNQKSFAVNLKSVQVNEEKNIKSNVPAVLTSVTPPGPSPSVFQSGSINSQPADLGHVYGNQYSTAQDITFIPTPATNVIPVTTSQNTGSIASSGISFGFYGTTPTNEINKIVQANAGYSKGISLNQGSLTTSFPTSYTGFGSKAQDESSKTVILSSTEVPVASATPTSGAYSYQEFSSLSHGDYSGNVPSVPIVGFTSSDYSANNVGQIPVSSTAFGLKTQDKSSKTVTLSSTEVPVSSATSTPGAYSYQELSSLSHGDYSSNVSNVPIVGFTSSDHSTNNVGQILGQKSFLPAKTSQIISVTPVEVPESSNFGQFKGVSYKQEEVSYSLPTVTQSTTTTLHSGDSSLKNVGFGMFNSKESSYENNKFNQGQQNFNLPSLVSVTPIPQFGQSGSSGSHFIKGIGTTNEQKSNKFAFSTPKVELSLPVVTSTSSYEILKQNGLAGSSNLSPGVISDSHAFGQNLEFNNQGNSNQQLLLPNFPSVTPKVQFSANDKSSAIGSVPISQPSSYFPNQQFTYFPVISSPRPFAHDTISQTPRTFIQNKGFTPAAGNSKFVTQVSIEPQEIVSLGTITEKYEGNSFKSVTPNIGAPKYTQSSFKSTSATLKPLISSNTLPSIPVSTPTPYTSTFIKDSPSPILSPQQINAALLNTNVVIPSASPQPNTFIKQPLSVSFGQKIVQHESSLTHDIKPVLPYVASSIAAIQNQQHVQAVTPSVSFLGQNNGFSTAVTPKIEIFRPQSASENPETYKQSVEKFKETFAQQNPQSSFIQNYEYGKAKPLAETEYRINQITSSGPVHVSSTLAPYGDVKIQSLDSLKTFNSKDELLTNLKTVELNPAFSAGNTNSFENTFSTTAKPVTVQQSIKGTTKIYGNKQFVKPFYESKGIGSRVSVSNLQSPQILQEKVTYDLPVVSIYGQNYAPGVKTQGGYLQGTPQTSLNQQFYSEVTERVSPVLPTVRTSINLLPETKSAQISNEAGAYIPPFEKLGESPIAFIEHKPNIPTVQQQSPIVNLLLPVTTEVPLQEYEENLKTQKANTANYGNSNFQQDVRQQNTFYKSQASGLDAFGRFDNYDYTQEVTRGKAGQLVFDSNKAVTQIPTAYITDGSTYSTSRPESISRPKPENQFSSYETRDGTKDFNGKTLSQPIDTLVSFGTQEEEHNDNIQELLQKYSGNFGQVITDQKTYNGYQKGKQASSTVLYEISTNKPKQRGRGRQYYDKSSASLPATNKYEEYEIDSQRSFNAGKDFSESSKIAIDSNNLDKNKKTVVVVSQVSEANPILIGKLAGQCSCQSDQLKVSNKNRKASNTKRKSYKSQESDLYSFDVNGNQGGDIAIESVTQNDLPGVGELTPETVIIGGRKKYIQGLSLDGAKSVTVSPVNVAIESVTQNDLSSVSELAPETVVIGGRKTYTSTILDNVKTVTVSPVTYDPYLTSPSSSTSFPAEVELSSTPNSILLEKTPKNNRRKQFRGKARYLPSPPSYDYDPSQSLSPILASDIALSGFESRTQNEISGGSSKKFAGAAYDRYGPGGWRGFDETLQGSVDCKRPGLFRHPKYCNKFYACNYDPWEDRFTLHVFNCPIRLTYDSSISACNWPVGGPACADDNLLV